MSLGEMFETYICFNRIISIQTLLDAIVKNGYVIEMENMCILESWEDDKKGIDAQLSNIDTQSIENKIVRLRFKMNSTYQAGFYLYKESSHVNIVNFWISCDHIKALKESVVTQINRNIYDCITHSILEVFSSADLIFAALGPEIYICYSDELKSIIHESLGVVRWIFSKNCDILYLHKYAMKDKDDFILFDKQ